jgi:hypothetical protein
MRALLLEVVEFLLPTSKTLFVVGIAFVGGPVQACLSHQTDSRLQTFCTIESVKGRVIDLSTADIIDSRLKREGYDRGIGLPGRVKPTSVEPYATPILDNSTDINGGNPTKDLVLGNLTFKGDPALYRKEGLLVGAGVGADGRHIYGEGRYVDFGIGASHAHSPVHDIGVARTFINACSKNHVRNHWYIDACASSQKLKRDIADDTNSTASFSVAKLFSTGKSTYHQASFGVRRFYEDDYEQNQLTFGLQTIHSNGIFTAVNASVGADVKDTLATKHSVSATVGTTLFSKPITATYAYSFADGGRLLGIARDDTSQSFTITYTVHPRVNITVGYRDLDSSINYFSESNPVIGIQFAPIRF